MLTNWRRLTLAMVCLICLPVFSAHAQEPDPPFNSIWEASSLSYPDEICPPWAFSQSCDDDLTCCTHEFQSDGLDGDQLYLETSCAENNAMSYEQIFPALELPDLWAIEFRVKIIYSHHLKVSDWGTGIVGFEIGGHHGGRLLLGTNSCQLLKVTTGGSWSIDKTYSLDGTTYHTYKIQVDKDTHAIKVFVDGVERLNSQTNYYSGFSDVPKIFWGSHIYGQLEAYWTYFKHNGYGGAIIVTNNNDDGPGSLREAINCANEYPGPNTITFDLPVPTTISPLSELPALNDATGGTTISGQVDGIPRSVIIDGSLLEPMGSTGQGLSIQSDENVMRDLIITNFWDHIQILGADNTVSGCYVGVGADGTTRASFGTGISIGGSGNMIGGRRGLEGNTIAADSGYVAIQIDGGLNTVAGNNIGTDKLGKGVLTPPRYIGSIIGVAIHGSGNRIGGLSSDSGNVFGDHIDAGIAISGDDNSILYNYIGVSADGTTIIPNGAGIHIFWDSNDNQIGNLSGAGNVISGNTQYGIAVTETPMYPSRRNSILQNLIFNNGGLGIDLADDGITENDIGDGDDGPNGLLNFPEISIAQVEGTNLRITAVAPPDAHIEYFEAVEDGSPVVPTGEHGEALRYLGSADAASDGAIDHLIDPGPSGMPVKITATATDLSGNTSEFSKNVVVSTSGSATAYSPINILITDPEGLQFGLDADGNPVTEIPGAEYHTEPYDSIFIPTMKIGTYAILYVRETGDPDPDPDYSSALRIAGLPRLMVTVDKEVPGLGEEHTFTYEYDTGCHYPNGDANRDDAVNIADAVYIINHVFKGGPPPEPLLSGDANCSLELNISDAVVIVNHVFKGGPPPCEFTS